MPRLGHDSAVIRPLKPAVAQAPARTAETPATVAPAAKPRTEPFEATPAAKAAVDPKPLAQVQGSIADVAKGLVGKGGWEATIIEAKSESQRHPQYERRYGDLNGYFPWWLETAEPAKTVPAHMNCVDMLYVTGVHAKAITPAQAKAIQDAGLAAAQLGGARSSDRVGNLPSYSSDVAENARSAFLFDALGYSRATELKPGAALNAGDVVFFGMPGDHVAIATGNGREVVSLWNRGSSRVSGHPIELTTVEALVEHFVKSVKEPTPEQIAKATNPDRLRTDHLPPRWLSPGVPHVRVASNPLHDLGHGEVPSDSESWKATARIVGDEGLKQLLDGLRAKLGG